MVQVQVERKVVIRFVYPSSATTARTVLVLSNIVPRVGFEGEDEVLRRRDHVVVCVVQPDLEGRRHARVHLAIQVDNADVRVGERPVADVHAGEAGEERDGGVEVGHVDVVRVSDGGDHTQRNGVRVGGDGGAVGKVRVVRG